MPTIEETQAWLSRFLDTEEELDRLLERIEWLRSDLKTPSSPAITGMPHGGGYEADRIGRTLARIDDLDAQAKELLAKSKRQYKEINSAISQVRNHIKLWPPRKLLLELRYLDRRDWEDIIEVLWGKQFDFDDRYDTYRRSTFRYHAEALEAMRIIIGEFQVTGNDAESEDTGK